MDCTAEPPDQERMWKVWKRLREPVFPTMPGGRPAPTREAVLGQICATLAAGTGTVHERFGHSLRGLMSARIDRITLYAAAPYLRRPCCADVARDRASGRLLYRSHREDRGMGRPPWPGRARYRHGRRRRTLRLAGRERQRMEPAPIQEQWDILQMEKPTWWGTGRHPSETA